MGAKLNAKSTKSPGTLGNPYSNSGFTVLNLYLKLFSLKWYALKSRIISKIDVKSSF